MAGEMVDARVADLERKLEQAVMERDDLEKDVEALCMQGGEFSGSGVLGMRIRTLEEQLSKVKRDLREAIAERDGVRDDLRHHRETRRDVDNSLKKEMERNATLEQELQYYMAQSGSIIAERDKATNDARKLEETTTEMRVQMLALQSAKQDHEDKMAEAMRKVASAEERSSVLATQVDEMKTLTAKTREDMEQARLQLRTTTEEKDAEIEKLSSRSASLAARNGEMVSQLDTVRKRMSELQRSSDEAEATIEALCGGEALVEKAWLAMSRMYRVEKEEVENLFLQARDEEEALSISSSKEVQLDFASIEEFAQLTVPPSEGKREGVLGSVVAAIAGFLAEMMQNQLQERAELEVYKHKTMSLKQKLAQATAEKVQANLQAASVLAQRNQ